MSTICGFFYFNDEPAPSEASSAMMQELGVYRADTIGDWQEGSVFLGCHAQHITPQSVREVLPYHDEQAGLIITADAIIDNRTELCAIFGIGRSDQEEVPDSLLILYAYQKWGRDCPKHLLGDYAFTIWDKRRRQMFCAVDHIGTRTFYYYRSNRLFAFSSLTKPLFTLPGITKEHNEIWIADFLAMPSVSHQLDPELTPYKNIYMLPAGCTLTVRPDEVVREVYWKVEKQTELKLKSDYDYEEAFREVLGEAVRCRLRSIRPVGIMLSGGLDSTSIACLASRELSNKGLRLHAFSSVPMNGYRDYLPASRLADETPYIEAIKEYDGSIDVTYCRSDGKHPVSDIDKFLSILEQPYKVFENLFWVDGVMAAAQEHNVGVLLRGDAGNVTISWGSVQPYLQTLIRTGNWRQFFHESWGAAKRYRSPRRKLLRYVLNMLPYDVQKCIKRYKEDEYLKLLEELSPINPQFARRALIHKRFQNFGYDPLFIKPMDCFEERKQRLSPNLFTHGAVLYTKLALAHQMVSRDPTADKRVIEFCLSVPDSQYVRRGQERFLLRRAMAGILPDKVRLNDTVRGSQSADWAQRLQPIWTDLAAEISQIGKTKTEREYLDIARIHDEVKSIRSLDDTAADNSNLRMLIRSLIFSRSLQHENIS